MEEDVHIWHMYVLGLVFICSATPVHCAETAHWNALQVWGSNTETAMAPPISAPAVAVIEQERQLSLVLLPLAQNGSEFKENVKKLIDNIQSSNLHSKPSETKFTNTQSEIGRMNHHTHMTKLDNGIDEIQDKPPLNNSEKPKNVNMDHTQGDHNVNALEDLVQQKHGDKWKQKGSLHISKTHRHAMGNNFLENQIIHRHRESHNQRGTQFKYDYPNDANRYNFIADENAESTLIDNNIEQETPKKLLTVKVGDITVTYASASGFVVGFLSSLVSLLILYVFCYWCHRLTKWNKRENSVGKCTWHCIENACCRCTDNPPCKRILGEPQISVIERGTSSPVISPKAKTAISPPEKYSDNDGMTVRSNFAVLPLQQIKCRNAMENDSIYRNVNYATIGGNMSLTQGVGKNESDVTKQDVTPFGLDAESQKVDMSSTETNQANMWPTETIEALVWPDEIIQALMQPTKTTQADVRHQETNQVDVRPKVTIQALVRHDVAIQDNAQLSETFKDDFQSKKTASKDLPSVESIQGGVRSHENTQNNMQNKEISHDGVRPLEIEEISLHTVQSSNCAPDYNYEHIPSISEEEIILCHSDTDSSVQSFSRSKNESNTPNTSTSLIENRSLLDNSTNYSRKDTQTPDHKSRSRFLSGYYLSTPESRHKNAGMHVIYSSSSTYNSSASCYSDNKPLKGFFTNKPSDNIAFNQQSNTSHNNYQSASQNYTDTSRYSEPIIYNSSTHIAYNSSTYNSDNSTPQPTSTTFHDSSITNHTSNDNMNNFNMHRKYDTSPSSNSKNIQLKYNQSMHSNNSGVFNPSCSTMNKTKTILAKTNSTSRPTETEKNYPQSACVTNQETGYNLELSTTSSRRLDVTQSGEEVPVVSSSSLTYMKVYSDEKPTNRETVVEIPNIQGKSNVRYCLGLHTISSLSHLAGYVKADTADLAEVQKVYSQNIDSDEEDLEWTEQRARVLQQTSYIERYYDSNDNLIDDDGTLYRYDSTEYDGANVNQSNNPTHSKDHVFIDMSNVDCNNFADAKCQLHQNILVKSKSEEPRLSTKYCDEDMKRKIELTKAKSEGYKAVRKCSDNNTAPADFVQEAVVNKMDGRNNSLYPQIYIPMIF